MKLLIYTVKDIKAGLCLRPMFANKRGQMLRTFGDQANNKNDFIGQHPEDYCLYQIGEFDDESMELKPIIPISEGLASSYVSGK